MPQNNIQKKQWRENYRPTAQVLQWPVCRLRRCHSAPACRRSGHCTPWAHVVQNWPTQMQTLIKLTER